MSRLSAAPILLLLLPAFAPQEETDVIQLTSHEIVKGKIVRFDAEGSVTILEKSRERTFPIEEIAQLRFGDKPDTAKPKDGHKVMLREGGVLSGTVESASEGRAKVATAVGTFQVSYGQIQTIHLASLQSSFPEVDTEKTTDILVTEEKDEEKKTSVSKAVYGKFKSLTGDEIVMEENGEERRISRSIARILLFYHEQGAANRTTGWFARISLHTGDRCVGTVHGIEKDHLLFFSRTLGRARVPRSRIRSVAFVSGVPVTVGSVLVCDQRGIRELDFNNKQLWAYNKNVNYCWSARKTSRGTVLIANSNYGRIIEVDRSSNEIVWQLDGLNYPYDVLPLKNGNIMVAEYYANRVAEYSRETRKVVWQTSRVRYPISLQVLDGGNILIASNREVIELKRGEKGKADREVWRSRVDGVQPWRASRLENGNTLIASYNSGQVVEVDPTGKKVLWKMAGLGRPCNAFRLDNGNTLILEQQNARIIEVDLAGRIINQKIKGLSYPQNMSIVK